MVIRLITVILMSEEMIMYRVQAFQLQEVEENLEMKSENFLNLTDSLLTSGDRWCRWTSDKASQQCSRGGHREPGEGRGQCWKLPP